MTPSTDEVSSPDSEVGVLLSGTGGVWRVRRADGSVVEASLRGRVKKSNAGRRADGSLRRDTVASAADTLKLAVGDRVLLDHDTNDARVGAYRYRLAVAADRTGDAQVAIDALRPLVDDADQSSKIAHGMAPELRGRGLGLRVGGRRSLATYSYVFPSRTAGWMKGTAFRRFPAPQPSFSGRLTPALSMRALL